ncbi:MULTISPECIES: recombinase family protein [Streptomyces]|uniref:recombinase family protein n=1 Tax=Streptomyces TaxID=1883 RepID=UPI00103BA6BF|nr:recombinase family protein [Streptomyces sp. KM273126]MBA2807695.1 recombinase family protein [Streptomyces sp. KM273126]
MTQAGITQERTAPTARPDPTAAVLYVCAERGTLTPSLAAERAEEEGRSYAAARGVRITKTISDRYGEPDPQKREGWMRVRELAAAGSVGVVLVRWPAAIAPDTAHEWRYREIRWLSDHGVQVRYSWAPLTSVGGEIK